MALVIKEKKKTILSRHIESPWDAIVTCIRVDN